MEFGLLGPLEIRDGERRLDPGPAKHRALLAAFLLNPGKLVGVERLITSVWDDDPPRSAESALRVYVSAIRRMLGAEFVRTVAGGYVVAVAPEQVDVGRFEGMLRAARQAADDGDLERARAGLLAALAVWRGPALADIDSAELRRTEAVWLEELRSSAVEHRIDLDLRLGRQHELVGELRRLVATHPLRERLWGQLMLALHRCGRRAEALDAYRAARETLARDLGLEPGSELRDLHQRILAGDPPAAGRLTGARGASEIHPVIPRELPADTFDFTGRESVLDWARSQALPGERPTAPAHIVFHGQPGVGKTALSVHAAALLEPSFPDGTLHADLRGVDARPVHPTRVLASFLRSLGHPDTAVPAAFPERARLFRTLLAGRRMLVVLDDAVNEAQVRPLLPATPGCAALITARSSLAGLAGARKCEIGVLSPDNSLRLLDRVAGPGRVAAEPAAAERIVTLCGRLPLAIRIAGARLAQRRAWTLAHFAGRLADERRRLDELAAGDLAVRSSIELGYRSLAARERRLLRRLGRLSAPDFAAWIAGPLLDDDAGRSEHGGEGGPVDQANTQAALEGERAVEALVDAGLVVPTGPDATGRDRYRMHALIRLYARERFQREEGDAAAALAGLARRTLALTREARGLLLPQEPGTGNTTAPAPDEPPRPQTRELRRSGDWLSTERAFLVSLVADLFGHGLHEETWRLAYYLVPFFEANAHHDDWRATHEPALRAAREHGHRRGEALLLRGLGDLHRAEGRLEEARQALEDSINRFGQTADRVEQAHSLRRLGLVHLAWGRLGDAETCLLECLPTFEESGDVRGITDTLLNLGTVLRHQGRIEEAHDRVKLCVPTFAWLADHRGQSAAYRQLSLIQLARGDLAQARRFAERALRICRQIRDRLAEAQGLTNLSQINRAAGALEPARRAAEEALRIAVGLGDRRSAAHARLACGVACLDLGEAENADRHIARSLTAFADLDDMLGLATARRARARAAAEAPGAAHADADASGHPPSFSPSIAPRAGT